MHVQRFDWDGRNVEHIGLHQVEPVDAEVVCRNRRSVVMRGRGGRYVVYGQTPEGRYLFIVLYRFGQGVVRIITARDMTDAERRFYHHRRR
ncbi:MAG: BrnT family toxin [Candidatus Omnitrophica bacterium]|nr:BrnT family toxin [Candidatus Omnitrophota bacterium]